MKTSELIEEALAFDAVPWCMGGGEFIQTKTSTTF